MKLESRRKMSPKGLRICTKSIMDSGKLSMLICMVQKMYIQNAYVNVLLNFFAEHRVKERRTMEATYSFKCH